MIFNTVHSFNEVLDLNVERLYELFKINAIFSSEKRRESPESSERASQCLENDPLACLEYRSNYAGHC